MFLGKWYGSGGKLLSGLWLAEKGFGIMGNGLLRINDWTECAKRANWCVQTLAKQCHVSPRTLERHIKRTFGKCPQDWLRDLRMHQAVELLLDDSSVKETALELGYKNQHHFSREFKKHTGHSPSQMQVASRAS